MIMADSKSAVYTEQFEGQGASSVEKYKQLVKSTGSLSYVLKHIDDTGRRKHSILPFNSQAITKKSVL